MLEKPNYYKWIILSIAEVVLLLLFFFSYLFYLRTFGWIPRALILMCIGLLYTSLISLFIDKFFYKAILLGSYIVFSSLWIIGLLPFFFLSILFLSTPLIIFSEKKPKINEYIRNAKEERLVRYRSPRGEVAEERKLLSLTDKKRFWGWIVIYLLHFLLPFIPLPLDIGFKSVSGVDSLMTCKDDFFSERCKKVIKKLLLYDKHLFILKEKNELKHMVSQLLKTFPFTFYSNKSKTRFCCEDIGDEDSIYIMDNEGYIRGIKYKDYKDAFTAFSNLLERMEYYPEIPSPKQLDFLKNAPYIFLDECHLNKNEENMYEELSNWIFETIKFLLNSESIPTLFIPAQFYDITFRDNCGNFCLYDFFILGTKSNKKRINCEELKNGKIKPIGILRIDKKLMKLGERKSYDVYFFAGELDLLFSVLRKLKKNGLVDVLEKELIHINLNPQDCQNTKYGYYTCVLTLKEKNKDCSGKRVRTSDEIYDFCVYPAGNDDYPLFYFKDFNLTLFMEAGVDNKKRFGIKFKKKER
jgi:hypothetical protein